MYKAASLSVPPTEGWQPSCTCPAQGLGALGLGTARGATGDTSPPARYSRRVLVHWLSAAFRVFN